MNLPRTNGSKEHSKTLLLYKKVTQGDSKMATDRRPEDMIKIIMSELVDAFIKE